MEAEEQRLGFVENRDGIAGAIAFSMQCRSQYRKAVIKYPAASSGVLTALFNPPVFNRPTPQGAGN